MLTFSTKRAVEQLVLLSLVTVLFVSHVISIERLNWIPSTDISLNQKCVETECQIIPPHRHASSSLALANFLVNDIVCVSIFFAYYIFLFVITLNLVL